MWMTSQDLAALCSEMLVEYIALQRQKPFDAVVETRETYLHGFVDYLVTKYATECFNQEELKHGNPKSCGCSEHEEAPCEPV